MYGPLRARNSRPIPATSRKKALMRRKSASVTSDGWRTCPEPRWVNAFVCRGILADRTGLCTQRQISGRTRLRWGTILEEYRPSHKATPASRFNADHVQRAVAGGTAAECRITGNPGALGALSVRPGVACPCHVILTVSPHNSPEPSPGAVAETLFRCNLRGSRGRATLSSAVPVRPKSVRFG